MDMNKKGSILAQLMAEEEDKSSTNNFKSKTDLDFITMLNTTSNNTPDKPENSMYVNKSFTFGNNGSVGMTPPTNNNSDHSRKSSLNYTPNKINPPPSNIKSTNSPTNTFRKAHRYKHSSVSINYNELLNITNKLNDEDDEKTHILVNKYLEFPTVKKVLKQFSNEQSIEVVAYLTFIGLLLLPLNKDNIKHILILTLQTLLQTSLFSRLSITVSNIILNDDYYKVYNFDYPFGFLRFNTIQEYATNLYNCYTVMNLFFEILEITMYGGDVHSGHGHNGHQHDKEFDSEIEKRNVLEQVRIQELVIVTLIIIFVGYKRNKYSLTISVTWLGMILFDSKIMVFLSKLVMIGVLFTYLITNIRFIVKYVLKYLNMSNVYGKESLYALKSDIDQILMTDKYSLKVADINNHTCMVLIKVDSERVNIIDIDTKSKVYNCVKSKIKDKEVMLTVEL